MSELLDFILAHEDAFRSRSRMASLYSDFSSQLTTNPDGYHANIAAWKKALADAVRAGVIPAQGNTRDLLNIRTGDELARALQHREFGRPTCLPAVIHDAVAKKELIPLKAFMSSKDSVYKTSWIPSPWSVAKWGLRQLGVIGEPGFAEKLEVGNFVVLSNVETAANEILKKMASQKSSVDLILSRTTFITRFSHILSSASPLSQNDLNILLTYLARDRRAISFDARTIKFKPENEAVPVPITQEDSAIANLRDTITKINSQIPPLAEKIATLDAAAREAVKLKQTIRARGALRSKKITESALAQRTDTAIQLESVYVQLQQAADQVEIVQAMKASAAALKGLNQKVGGTEGVSDVVDALKEEMATADDISNIINESGQPIDESEVDEEFAALEKAEREKQEQEEAAKTAARLAELEAAEKKRKERRAADKEKEEEAELLQTSQDFARISFQETGSKDEPDKENKPVSA
ncbi:hypothetical protein K469DRAFT_703825 [Zopfia rhizophila CBS 207.26]|uniref:Snf7-domain-containing protein n=1 Tax=Zopfia rhizophila CBS 207.26 TaxID=1314779 RepID=A0A6A6EDX3_9PEZI|nr:hypothetical protein K469DRAFT_703825 [Zopfia rhizophila CBS 207.26]